MEGALQESAHTLVSDVHALLAMGDLPGALRRSRDAEARAMDLGDRMSEAEALDLQAAAHSAGGDFSFAAKCGQKAVDGFLGAGDHGRAAKALQAVCEALVDDGRVDDALHEAQKLREACQQASAPVAEGQCLMALCHVYGKAMKLDDCLRSAREALTLFQGGDDQLGQAQALTALAETKVYRGVSLEMARRAALRARRIFEKLGSSHAQGALRAAMVECHATVASLSQQPLHVHTAGGWAEAQRATQEIEEAARAIGDLRTAASALSLAAHVHGACDKFLASMRSAASAAELYRDHGDRDEVFRALMIASDAALRARRLKDARRMCTEAVAIAHEMAEAEAEAEAKRLLARIDDEPTEGAAMDKEDVPDTLMNISARVNMSPQDLLSQVLNLDVLFTPLDETPLFQPGAQGPFKAMGLETFLALGQSRQQANAVLAYVRSHDAETRQCRPTGVVPGQAFGGKRRGEGAAWVAPVRKRMDRATRFRPNDASQGLGFASWRKRQ